MKKILSVFVAITAILSLLTFFASAEETDVDFNDEGLLTVNAGVSLNLNAKAYLLMDKNTGTVLAAKNENQKLYPASVTKIMSLLLICDAIDAGKLSFDEVITCSDTAAAKGGSQIWLEPGEQMTVDELLKATFVYSANDACTLLGEQVAGSESAFAELMNKRAEELGMTNTHFDNCTGLDDDTTTHLTTAYDVALMSRELLKKDYIKKYTTVWMDTLRNGATQLVNTNKLMRYYDGATGLKTGTTTKAGCCISATAERNGLELIAVVLGADHSNDRFNSARALLDYGFANYEICSPSVTENEIPEIAVEHGTVKSVKAVPDKIPEILVNNGAANNVTNKIVTENSVQAPVAKDTVLGQIEFFCGETKIAQINLLAKNDVERMTFTKAFIGIFKSVSTRK